MTTASNHKIEAILVSMAGTAIHLNDLVTSLERKPVVAKVVVASMPKTQSAYERLLLQLRAAQQLAAEETLPAVEQWLLNVGLQVGGSFSASTNRKFGSGPIGKLLRVRGGIAAACVNRTLVDGVRVMDITLVDGELVLPDGARIQAVGDIPVREQPRYNLAPLRDVWVPDAITGVPSRELHVRIPIQANQRDRWSTSGQLVRD